MSKQFLVKVIATNEPRSKTIVVGLSSDLTKEDTLGAISAAFGFGAAAAAVQSLARNLGTKREGINLNDPKIETISDMGICGNDSLFVKFEGDAELSRVAVEEEVSGRELEAEATRGRYSLRKKSREVTLQKMRSMDEASKMMEGAESNDSKTKKYSAYQGIGNVFGLGGIEGKSISSRNRAKKPRFTGAGYRLKDGETVGRLYVKVDADEKLIEDICADDAAKIAFNVQAEEMYDDFIKGNLRKAMDDTYAYLMELDQWRSILTCLSTGNYAIIRGSKSDYISFLEKADVGDEHKDDYTMFTVKLRPIAAELFDHKEISMDMILCSSKDRTIEYFKFLHKLCLQQGNWIEFADKELLREQQNALWSMVYFANQTKGYNTDVVGQSWGAKLGEMLSCLIPDLDWSNVKHGDAEGDREITPSLKCAEYNAVKPALKECLGSDSESEEDEKDGDYK